MNSVADIWKIVLSRLSQDLSETTISTWFDEVEAVSIKDRTLYLHCPNDFKRSTIESMFSDRIKDSLRDIYSADFDVKLLSTAESTALFEPEVKKSTALLDSGEFTFDTFVVGESNKMAYAAARAVADGVGHYNPLFIYGDSGLGKTHLIYAIAHQIRTTRPSAKIIYIKGDDFINEFIELVRAGPRQRIPREVPRRGPAARRRRAVRRGQGAGAERIFPYVQHALRGRPPDRPDLRSPAL